MIRALEHIARVESPLKRSLRGLAPLFIVDPLECGKTNWVEYLDEVARIEAQPDKSKAQRDAEAAQLMAKSVPLGLFQHTVSSHPPIHDRIVRLRGLLHEASGPAQESEAEITARRKAAEKTVTEITQTSPEAMMTVVEAMLGANPAAQQLMRALGQNAPSSESETAEPPEKDETGADPFEEAAYRKLYKYNLGLTGDRDTSGLEAERPHPPQSPFEALLRGQLGKMDPAQLREALAIGMAAAQKKRAAPSLNATADPAQSKTLQYIFWIVIALSAGAIAAALALR